MLLLWHSSSAWIKGGAAVITKRPPFHVMALTLLVTLLSGAAPATAHGKGVNIAVTCMAPDPGRPLTKVCTAFLKYVDGDPVSRANFHLTATREGRAEPDVGPVAFRPLEQEGLYSATITLPAYGRWRMRFRVQAPNRGEAELREELLPPRPGATPEIRAQLQIVFNFGLADVRNIAVRAIHLLAAMLWFASVALVLVLSRLAVSQQQWPFLRRAATAFPWAAGGGLLLLAVTGIYIARYNAPIRPPGLFAPQFLARLPFGQAYLAAFFLKMSLMLAIVVMTAVLALALRKAYLRPVSILAGGAYSSGLPRLAPERRVMWLAALNLMFGVFIFADVVVLAYLHIISHVAAAAGAR